MPVFISYSHENKGFVNRFAADLVKNRTWVWVDRWELKVGDSIIERVQSAIKEASALIIVLSKASVESQWCKKELSAGLVLELEKKRVVVLPALIEDCEIPLFLKDKMYADFRSSYDVGLQATLNAIANVTSDSQGRVETEDFYSDWALDWGRTAEKFQIRVTIVEHASTFPYSVLTEVVISPNAIALARYKQYESNGLDWLGRLIIIESIVDAAQKIGDTFVTIGDSLPVEVGFGVEDPKTGLGYDIRISTRRLGEDTGGDVFVNWGQELQTVRNRLRAASRLLNEEESQKLAGILRSPVAVKSPPTDKGKRKAKGGR